MNGGDALPDHPALTALPPRDDAAIAALLPARSGPPPRTAFVWIAAGYALFAAGGVIVQGIGAGQVHWLLTLVIAALVIGVLVGIVWIASSRERWQIRMALRYGRALPVELELARERLIAAETSVVHARYAIDGRLEHAAFVLRNEELPLVTLGAAVIHRKGARAVLLVPARLAVLQHRDPKS